MNLNEVSFDVLSIGDNVVSNLDQVSGTIQLLETTPTANLITIGWSTNMIMKFNHNWATDITYLGV